MAAHAIVLVKYDDGIQDNFPVWESVYLVDAYDFEEAARKATQIVHDNLADTAAITCEDRPAHLLLVGIRKVVRLALEDGSFSEGLELTYSQFEVASEEDLTRLAEGEPVNLSYEE